MSTTVVLNLPSSGHINPTLPIVSELIKRGEKVIYYGTEPFRPRIEKTGAEYRGYHNEESLKTKFHKGGHLGVMAHLINAAQLNLPALLEDFKESPPDYILLDSMCIWGNHIQQITGIPAITFSSIFVMHPKLKADDILDMAYSSLSAETLLHGIKALHRYLKISQEIDKTFACESPGLIEAFSNQHELNILFTAKELHPLPHLFDEDTYKFVGPSIAPRNEEVTFPFERITSDTVIYISFGTIVNDVAEFYNNCFKAFGNRADRPYPHQVILSIGDRIDPATLDAIPDNFIVKTYVPQLEVLKRASVFISHGGMNSSGEALYNSVPLVIIPQRGDTYMVLDQVSNFGAGIGMLPAEVSPDTLLNAVETILSTPSYKEKAQELSKIFINGGGYIRAADEIMSHKENLISD